MKSLENLSRVVHLHRVAVLHQARVHQVVHLRQAVVHHPVLVADVQLRAVFVKNV